jgi:hypothetical protein
MRDMKIMNTILMAIACAVACAARASGSNQLDETTQWGRIVAGIQSSVSLSNNVFSSGATIIVKLQAKNSSTNTVKLEPSNLGYTPWCEFNLTDGSGRIFKFTHAATVILATFPPVPLKPGELCGWDIPVVTKKGMESGDCFLNAKALFEREGQLFFLVSNSLKVQLK